MVDCSSYSRLSQEEFEVRWIWIIVVRTSMRKSKKKKRRKKHGLLMMTGETRPHTITLRILARTISASYKSSVIHLNLEG